MRRTSVARLAALGLSLALVAAACGGGDKTAKEKAKESTTTGSGSNAGKAPEPAPGFDGSTITLGVITPQSGTTGAIAGKYLGTPLTDGNKLYWQAKNDKGGVAGKYKVQLKVADSQYDATVGGQAYDGMKNDVLAFQQILGTAVLQAIQPKLDTDNVLAGPATLDAEWNQDSHLFPFVTSYQLLAINGLDYYVKHGGGKGKTICSLAQDDAYGDAGVQGAEFAAKKLGFTLKTEQRVKLLGDKTAAVQALKDNKCDAVLTTLLFVDMKSLVSTARQLGYEAKFILEAPAWERGFTDKTDPGFDQAFSDYLTKNMWVAATGPQWGDTSNPGMAQMLDLLKKYKPDQKANLYFMFGYGQAWALDQILEKAAANGDFSREGLQKAMWQIGSLKFDNLIPDYKYGTSVDQRVTPLPATIFSVDPSIDGGLKVLAADYVADAAKSFKLTS
ncbi:MAG: ABC transporter substrate-binding protein [Acidimicrobiia bacterium]